MGYQNERLNVDRLAMLQREVDFSDTTVLDIGCAEGWFCRKLTNLGAKVVGICDSYHEEAKALAKKENLNIDFRFGNFMDMEHEHFNCVLFLSVLHYFHTE